MKKIIVFNHKMSLLYDDLYNYIERTNNLETDNDIIICPSDIYLEAFVNNSDWLIGSQNLNYNTDYKHTGEISTDQLKSLGVEYSIIGHYERVRDFNENAVIINNVFSGILQLPFIAFLLSNHIIKNPIILITIKYIIIFCVNISLKFNCVNCISLL